MQLETLIERLERLARELRDEGNHDLARRTEKAARDLRVVEGKNVKRKAL